MLATTIMTPKTETRIRVGKPFIHRRDTENAENTNTSFLQAQDQSSDSSFQHRDIEIDQQSRFPSTQSQVG